MLTAAQQARLAAAAPLAETPLALPAATATSAAQGAPALLADWLLAILEALLSPLKALAALAGVGGKTMGLGKVIFGVGLLAVLGGGFYCYQRPPTAVQSLKGFLLDSFIFRNLEALYLTSFRYWQFTLDKQGHLIDTRGHYRAEPTKKGYGIYSEIPESLSREYKQKIPDLKTGKLTWVLEYEIILSRSVPGDWDLAATLDHDSPDGLIHYDPPIPSFFHRITDDRARLYYDGVGNVYNRRMYDEWFKSYILPEVPPYPEFLFKLAADMVHDHPDDPAFRMLYWDSLIRAENFKVLESELGQWRSKLDHPGFQRLGLRFAEHALKAHHLSAAGQNAADEVIQLFSTHTNLQTLYQCFPDLLKYDELHYPNPGLQAPPDLFRAYNNNPKVIYTLSILSMIKGERDAALERLAALWHLGQLLEKDGLIDNRKYIPTICGTAGQGLELYALNACETESDYAALWHKLDYLVQHEPRIPTLKEFVWLEHNFAPVSDQQLLAMEKPKFYDYLASDYPSCTARLQLIRMATAARAHALATGSLPDNERDLGPLLPAGPPPDPFSTTPLHLVSSPGGVSCYSVGPDKIDDRGALIYDPSNGTLSRGDIVLEVPATRKYPFPRGGLRMEYMSDFWHQMPNGLPPDPFADTRGKPLNITNGPPFYVYSYGPDHDEHVLPMTRPQVAYDPSNGTSSSGDLFIAIPER